MAIANVASSPAVARVSPSPDTTERLAHICREGSTTRRNGEPEMCTSSESLLKKASSSCLPDRVGVYEAKKRDPFHATCASNAASPLPRTLTCKQSV
eukprot:3053469-Rhodomonas_salina.1